MILKALYDYYETRKKSLPAYGLELKQIGFIIVISKDGRFLRIDDRRSDDKKSAYEFMVVKSVGRSSAPVPNHLYDNAAYVLCYSDKPKSDPAKCNLVFKNYIIKLAEKAPDNADLRALLAFYGDYWESNIENIKSDPLWPDVEKNLGKKFSFFSFKIDGEDDILAEKEELVALAPSLESPEGLEENQYGRCLITGESDEIVPLIPSTMIPGSQATAKLVSFQVSSGYDSYGKTKGQNAPIGKKASFAFTTALNEMLKKDSRNKTLLGTRTFLYWPSISDAESDEMLRCVNLLLEPGAALESEEKDVMHMKKTFSAIFSGLKPTVNDDRFFILGLSPNAARIAPVFWADIPLKEFAQNILNHFDDFEIQDTRQKKSPYFGVRNILAAVTLGGKSSDAIPSLPEALAKSIFQNLPYPDQLYQACIRRIRAEQTVGIVRAAIIKAYLNRKYNQLIKLTVMLDKENTSIGYVCGRLFATIEKIQMVAQPGINSTVKSRYLNSASATPLAVFPTLLNLSAHHVEKIPDGRKTIYEKLKEEIISKIDANGFPAQLSLADQGRFFIGYYHQMQDFFTPKKEKESDSNE